MGWGDEHALLQNSHSVSIFQYEKHITIFCLIFANSFFFTIASLSGQKSFEVFFLFLAIILYFVLWLTWIPAPGFLDDTMRLCQAEVGSGGPHQSPPSPSPGSILLGSPQVSLGVKFGRNHSLEGGSGDGRILEGQPCSLCYLKKQ